MTTEDEEKAIEATKAPLMDHLIELRSRLIKAILAFAVAAVVCFFFAKQIYNVLTWPYIWVAGPDSKFIYTGLLEYFVVQLKLAMFGAAFIAFPVIAGQIYMFVAPGLYRNEKQAFLPYLIATPIFFLMGAMVVYFVVWPMLARFSLSMQQLGGPGQAAIELLPKVEDYLVADDEAGAGVRRRLSASGGPDAARPRRHHHLRSAQIETPLFHRHRVCDRGDPDAAGRAEPDVACAAAGCALRGLDLVGALGGEAGGGRTRGFRRRGIRQAGGVIEAYRLDC